LPPLGSRRLVGAIWYMHMICLISFSFVFCNCHLANCQ
jgi:hypothetical protein